MAGSSLPRRQFERAGGAGRCIGHNPVTGEFLGIGIDIAGAPLTAAKAAAINVFESQLAVGIRFIVKCYTLGDNVERLTLIGTGEIFGAGNARNNAITGNGAANELRGERGNDRLSGGGGADDIYGGLGNDRLSGGAGADGFYFDTALNA
ncbi:MAG: hypothetical protein H0U34_02240, partial [Sphingomonas sp.]|nr:hypothetical protein [Sphingomonas sp.]